MPRALLCTTVDLSADLGHTCLWRFGMERRTARSLSDARAAAAVARPDIVIVDRDLPEALPIIKAFRADAATRGISIAVVARDDFDPTELELLQSGANAILRLPAGREWDERFMKLIDVPVRREVRFDVQLHVQCGFQGEPLHGSAVNLSVSGMLLATPAKLAMGDDVEVDFVLPSGDGVHVVGRVVRLASPGKYGVQFDHVDVEAPERIRRFVQAVNAG